LIPFWLKQHKCNIPIAISSPRASWLHPVYKKLTLKNFSLETTQPKGKAGRWLSGFAKPKAE